MSEAESQELIAIVGMAGRFPGANDVDGFWANLCAGVESIRTFSEAELTAAGADRSDPAFVSRGSVMEGVERFDAPFFGMSRREAELTDPQHRVFLECAWTAIEHAGYDPATYDGRIGVFGGVSPNTYFRNNVSGHPDLLARVGDYQQLIATEREYAITRVAYRLGLRGPAVSINTASSTSAVALHFAIGSLLSGESDLAIAGGCRIRVPTTVGYVYTEDGILSPDGHCRPFDADARGTVMASGAAIVALKRFQDASDDADTVYAVIRGSAVNNDGPDKIGYAAPSVGGQAAVIAEALAVSEVDADTMGMVEAHGTGTSLGDPIEITALTRAYRQYTDRRQYCAIGSLKSNLGHLDSAAGVAGVIKATLSLYHEVIPPTINFTAPNPHIDFADSPFFVNTELRPWLRSDKPRRAAVSSFGLGGTNAHVVLEEAPPTRAAASPARPIQLLPLSAKTSWALERRRRELADHLESRRDLDLADVAYTLGAGRARMLHRQALVASSAPSAVAVLRGPGPRDATARVAADEGVGVAFLFPGQGAQHVGMGAGLYGRELAFTKAMDDCANTLEPIVGLDLRELLFTTSENPSARNEALAHAGLAQPATFSMSYALARLWMSWGVQPSAVCGHSMGEFVAACLAGLFSLEEALALIAERGRLSQEFDGGRMMAVLADPAIVSPLLDGETSIAAINLPTLCVASGPEASIDALEERLRAQEVETRRLPIEHAAHSPMLQPMIKPFRARVAAVTRGPLRLPMFSTVTGDRVTDEQITSADYWADHLTATVRFSDAIGRLLEQPDLVLLEVGAGQTLTTLARRHPAATSKRTITASLRHARHDTDDQAAIMRALGQLWAAGVDVDWKAVHGGSRRRIGLPTYPFDHDRYWIDPVSKTVPVGGSRAHDSEQIATEPDRTEMLHALSEPSRPRFEAHATDAATSASARVTRIAAELTGILADLSGIEASSIDPSANFSDLGFDSLFLTQANSQFRKRFGVRVTFRQLLEEAPYIHALAAFIDARLAPDASPAAGPAADERESSATLPGGETARLTGVTNSASSGSTSADAVQQLIGEQLRIMEKQLALIRSGTTAARAVIPAHSADPVAALPPVQRRRHYLATRDEEGGQTGKGQALDEAQQAALANLVRRYNSRTKRSKRLAQLWRPRLADNRTIVGFDVRWKELVYQIVSERSKGSRIWDVDGNEFIDTALGFGTDLLGHSPDLIVEAIRKQLELGYEVAVQNQLVGEVSEMICAATSNERLTFASSGGEAVATAIRVARTSTGRDKVAYFSASIHGRNDTVLGRAVDVEGRLRSVPLVAGVPQSVVADTLVLEYGTQRALQEIQSAARELALVLVEPVQTRHPDLQPVEFLMALRRMADEHGFLLVFDEVVTGFRAHHGGVQAMFGIRADMTTYGKVVGGGLPVGVLAGRSELIDVVDGGPWTFGDNSFPEADITASGGTLIKHPLTLAASRAVLAHLEERGPSLQSDLSRRTSEAVAAINEAYKSAGLPIHVEHFSSFFRPTFGDAPRFAGLFEFYLREQGVHSNPPSPSFLSTAHNEADIEAVIAAYVAAGREMEHDGFLERLRTKRNGRANEASGSPPASAVPVLPNVARFLESNSPDSNQWNLGVLLRPRKPLDPELVRRTVQTLIERHHALRLRFFDNVSALTSSIAPVSDVVPFSSHDLSDLPQAEQRPALERLARETQGSLDLERGPLIRIVLFDLGEHGQRLLVIIHHFATDGISWHPFWQDFERIYKDFERGGPITPAPPSTTFEQWAHTLKRRADSADLKREARMWLELPWESIRPIPLDFPNHNGANTNESARQLILEFTSDETTAVFQETAGVTHKIDLLMTALARATAEWTGCDTVLFDVLGHGRDEETFEDVDLFGTVGFFNSYTPMLLQVSDKHERAGSHLLTDQIRPILRRGLDFDLLRFMTSDATIRQMFSALPRAHMLLNHLGKRDELDVIPSGSMFTPASESIGDTHRPRGLRRYPIAIMSQVWKDQLRLNIVYSENLHERSTIEALAANFKASLMAIVALSRSPEGLRLL